MIKPPSVGPTASPAATEIPTKPSAWPRCCGGTFFVTIAGPMANSMPAPTACTTRAATSTQTLGASEQRSEPPTKTTNPAKYTRLSPSMSPRRPNVKRNVLMVSR